MLQKEDLEPKYPCFNGFLRIRGSKIGDLKKIFFFTDFTEKHTYSYQKFHFWATATGKTIILKGLTGFIVF